MLYTDTPQMVFTFDPADGRYALSQSLSRSTPAYTLSCGRGEPYTPSHPTPSTSTPTFQPAYPIHSISSTPTMEGRSHLKYPVLDMRETRPGVLATGHWTANHPLVDAYLAALERLAPRQRPQQAPRALTSLPPTAAASPVLTPHAYIDARVSSPPATHAYASHSEDERLRWRAQQGGIASVCTVAQVVTVQYELFPGPGSAWYAAQVPRLSEEQKQVVFALAALRVLNHPTHPAHWALWAKNVLRRTAQVVEDVLQLNPCPIVSPVGWLGLPESIWALHGLQSSFIPPPPQPEKPKTGGMTLRKRKATAAASNNAAEEEVALRVSPRKRQRTTRAQAALAQAEVVAPVSAPTSMLLDIPPSGAVAADAGAASKAMKQDMLDVDVPRTSPALQPLALMVPDTTTALPLSTVAMSTSESLDSASARASSTTTARATRSATSLSPSATRRSNRSRRKPAHGPVTLSGSVSAGSTPLSTPGTSPAPLEQPEGSEDSVNANAGTQDGRPRAGSCGSSTAVSETGDASEGTVVDLESDVFASGGASAKGKRKADDVEAEAEVEPVENPTPAPALKGRKTARGKGGSARSRKRVKIDEGERDIASANVNAAVGAEEGAAAAPARDAKTQRRTSGGGGARKKAAVRRA